MYVKYIVNALSPVVNSNDESEERNKNYDKTESDTQIVLDETGFGKFNYKVVGVSGLIALNIAITLVSVGFILPSAACDFHMNTIDKGRLSTSIVFGLVLGSCIWGCVADTSGRRKALLYCLFLQCIFDCAASVMPNYWAFLVLKFFSGASLSGQLAIVYTYVGEFQPTKYRERVLAFMEIPTCVGLATGPLLAWLIIPLEFHVTLPGFSFKSWNLYVASSAMPALLTGFMLLRLPETPKYLAMSGRYPDLRKVLTRMYHENTGKPSEEYNFGKLDAAGTKLFTDQGTDEVVHGNLTIGTFLRFFKTLYTQTGMLLKRPYITRTIITCLSTYFILSCLYTLMLWFPELFQRFAAFEATHGHDEWASVCTVSHPKSQPIFDNKTISTASIELTKQVENVDNDSMVSHCNSSIDTNVYINTLLVGASAIPLAILYPFFIGRLGFRLSLILGTFVSCGTTIALLFVRTSTENLVLSCIYEAVMSICATAVLCIIVELFPTNLRGTASALSSLCGRVGALIGNATFGYLIDHHCVGLISFVAAQIFLTGILALFLPSRIQSKSKKDSPLKVVVLDLEERANVEKYSPANTFT